MNSISKEMNAYRECIRHLWNTYFLNQISEEENWNAHDSFEEISTRLFSALVLTPINKSSYSKSHAYDAHQNPLLFLHVVPSLEAGVPVKINREINASGYWDHPVHFVKPNDVDLRFIDFFDFDLLGYRDFEYCRVRIVGASESEDLIERDALLRCRHVDFLFDDK